MDRGIYRPYPGAGRAGIWDLTNHFHPGLRGGWCVLWLQKGKQREIFQIGAGIVFP